MEASSCAGGEGQGKDEGRRASLMRLVEVSALCCVPMALKAAIQLNVMDILAEHAGEHHFLSASQIASHFPSTCTSSSTTTPLSLDRILRVLASQGLLASSSLQTPQGDLTPTYALNSVSRLLVRHPPPPHHINSNNGDNNPPPSTLSFAAPILFLQDPTFVECLYNLHESVLDGSVPFTKAHGMPLFSYTQADPRINKVFNDAMSNSSRALMFSLLEIYHGFHDIASLVDLGGGIGTCIAMITSKHPHIKGINFDQPNVIATAPNYPGVEHIEGDMFLSIPKADAIFMKGILHDWNDADCLKIFEKCYQALPKNGKIIVVGVVLPTSVECGLHARVQYLLDLLMFAHNGGKERTKLELERLAKAAGFAKLELICNVHSFSVVEIYKE